MKAGDKQSIFSKDDVTKKNKNKSMIEVSQEIVED